jgi:tRNA dimethylallyltransferase
MFWVDPGKEILDERIGARAAAMVRDGLLDEVRGLLARGVPADARPLQSVGYAEAMACLRNEIAEPALAEAIAASTRKLAKSQRTWFKGEELARGPVNADAIRTALLGP